MEGSNQGSSADQAKEKAQQATAAAQDKAQEVAEQARGRIREQVDQRSSEVGDQLSGTAGDVRSVAEELRKQGKDKPAELAEQAADRVERAGGYLRDSDADRILRDVEDFGRRQPWAVVAGGLALGFVASRFLKASSQRRYDESRREVPSTTSRLEYGSSAAGGPSAAVPAAPPRSPAVGEPVTTPSG